MWKLFFDIETIPTQNEKIKNRVTANLSPPKNISKPETLQKWVRDDLPKLQDEAWRKTSLDGTFGEIVSIAYAVEDGEEECIYRKQGESEFDLLVEFSSIVSEHSRQNNFNLPHWIGHNIVGFDLRFLWQRCVINDLPFGIRIPADAKPWAEYISDTMLMWKGSSYGGASASMDALCVAFGMEGKGDLDGSKIWDYWRDGRYDEIVEYNKLDVKRTRIFYERMR